MKPKFFLPLILFIFSSSFAQSQEPTYWEDYADISWWGKTQDDKTYTITTAEQLAGVAWLTTNKYYSLNDTTIVLANDIDLSAHYWTPIGTRYFEFIGHFDGNNKTIKGMKIGTDNSIKRYYVGLFGAVSGHRKTIIKNLTIEESSIKNNTGWDSYTGALIGYVETIFSGQLEIRNCTVKTTTIELEMEKDFYSTSAVGGLVGACVNLDTLIISQCTYDGQIRNKTTYPDETSGMNSGGIIGYVKVKNLLEITGCTNNGQITSGVDVLDSHIGGIIGYSSVKSNGAIHIENNLNTGTIRAGNLSKKSQGSSYTGGIVGYNNTYDVQISTTYITNCTNEGQVEGGAVFILSSESNTGGILGGGMAEISLCTNKGQVTGGKASNGGISGTGGIIGYLQYNDSQLSECVNEGLVTGGDTYGAASRTGGIVGHTGGENSLTITGCSNKKEVLIGKISYSDESYAGSSIIGGIVGSARTAVSFILKDCQNYDRVKGNEILSGVTGGIAGSIRGLGFVSVSDCLNSGTVEGGNNMDRNANVYESNTGGIVGYMAQGLDGIFSITTCINTGKITGGAIKSTSIYDSNTGGILGYGKYQLLISDCISSGEVTGGKLTDEGFVTNRFTNTGGIVGCVNGKITVANCLVDSKITGGEASGDLVTSNTGGILGFSCEAERNAISNCIVISPVLMGGDACHRIVGQVDTSSRIYLTILENNYAWAGIPGTWGDKGIAGLDGADWSGNMSAEPIKGWDAALWKVDASHEYMPQLDLAGAPLIRNPLSGSIAVEAVRSNSRVYVQGGQLYVDHPESAGRSEVRIYSLSGTLIHQETLLHSPQAIPVPKGIYIVVTGGEAVKVVL